MGVQNTRPASKLLVRPVVWSEWKWVRRYLQQEGVQESRGNKLQLARLLCWGLSACSTTEKDEEESLGLLPSGTKNSRLAARVLVAETVNHQLRSCMNQSRLTSSTLCWAARTPQL